ncbi:MAG: Lrp/AsnC ligand binding domain-containing protein [Bacteroidota bacterium]
MKEKLDELDRKILVELLNDARQPYTDIAKKLFVSSGTIHVRMGKMEEMGIVEGSSIAVDLEKLGLDVVAFLGIFLSKSSLYDEVSAGLKRIPEIVEAHYTTGNYSIFARIVCRDTNHLREVLHDKIQEIEGIQRTETFISLEEGFRRPVSIGVESKQL